MGKYIKNLACWLFFLTCPSLAKSNSYYFSKLPMIYDLYYDKKFQSILHPVNSFLFVTFLLKFFTFALLTVILYFCASPRIAYFLWNHVLKELALSCVFLRNSTKTVIALNKTLIAQSNWFSYTVEYKGWFQLISLTLTEC